MISIRLNNVGLKFPSPNGDGGSLKKRLFDLFGSVTTKADALPGRPALNDINIEVKAGERVGIVGRNGAGKTTLLRVISGILPPTEGSVDVSGRVTPLLGLAIGFEPELNAVENIFIRSLLLGRSKKETAKVVDEILDFAELVDYAQMPLRSFSAGMYLRLAFAVSTSIEPEILLVDEAINAGDARFRIKSQSRIEEMIAKGRVVILSTHATHELIRYCNRVIWLHEGCLRMDGDVDTVIEAYGTFMRIAPSGPTGPISPAVA